MKEREEIIIKLKSKFTKFKPDNKNYIIKDMGENVKIIIEDEDKKKSITIPFDILRDYVIIKLYEKITFKSKEGS